MTRSLLALTALLCLAAPAFADPCAAATEAAMRAAIQSAEATGRRTATVRVTCGGERQILLIHRTSTASGTSITVREVTKSTGSGDLAGGNLDDFGSSSTSRVIRVRK